MVAVSGRNHCRRELCPQMVAVSGRNHCQRELCPQMVTVSGRKLHSGAKGNTFVPEKGIFPGETTAGGELCPQMWPVSGRNHCRREHLSTKHPSSVDKCHPPAVRIHKTPSQRGQMPPPGSAHPQNTLPAWTNATARQCASTKHPPSVDKCRRPAVRIHKIPSQCGQMPPPGSAHPQNTPPAWMKAAARQCASTKHHRFVDAGNHFRGQ